MSDDRVSESTNPPRCPVCATGFTGTPGAEGHLDYFADRQVAERLRSLL